MAGSLFRMSASLCPETTPQVKYHNNHKVSQGRQRDIGTSGFDPADIQPGIETHDFLSQVMPSSGFRQPVSNLPDKKVISSLPFHSANYRIYTLIYNYK